MTRPEGKGKYHIMMCFLMTMWGLEAAIASDALDTVKPLVIMNFKFFLAFIFIGIVCFRTGNLQLPRRQDLPAIIGTTILGHLIYFYGEYSALALDVPVANMSVAFGFLPVGTVLIERIVFKHKISMKLILLMLLCITGITLTIGTDLSQILSGRMRGYLMVLVALGAWLAYLFLTESVAGKYGSLKIAFYQTTVAWVLTVPFMIPHLHEFQGLEHKVLLEMIYLGIISEGLCFIIEVTGIEKLGSTISAVYSNFLPVTTAFFGLLLLGQDLVPLQYAGGITVIVSGFFIIREKDRLDRLRERL